jgi:hypothetical protein
MADARFLRRACAFGVLVFVGGGPVLPRQDVVDDDGLGGCGRVGLSLAVLGGRGGGSLGLARYPSTRDAEGVYSD